MTAPDLLDTLAPGKRLDELVDEIAHEYASRFGSPTPSTAQVSTWLEAKDLVAWCATEINKASLSPNTKRFAYRCALGDIVDAMTEEQALEALQALLSDNFATVGDRLHAALAHHVADELQDRISGRMYELEEEQSTDRKSVSFAALVDDPVRADRIALARGSR